SGRPSVEWRRYMLRRLAGFHDPDMAAVFKPALKDKDPDITFYASLGLLGLGKHDGLDIMLLAAKQRWAEFGDITAEVLPASRANENAMPIFEKIAAAQPTDQMAGLRLLRYLMVKEQGILLRRYLESADFTVKKEAINTARVLHGEQPLDQLSRFQAIDQAKQWLGKLEAGEPLRNDDCYHVKHHQVPAAATSRFRPARCNLSTRQAREVADRPLHEE